MAGNKRPRKKHHQRPLMIPKIIDARMAADEHPELALGLHLAIVNLIEAPTTPACNAVSRRLSEIAGAMSYVARGQPIKGQRDAGSIAIQSAIRVIEDIVDRWDIAEKVTVRSDEAKTLRAAAGKLDEALARIPLSVFNRAKANVHKLIGDV
jgi:hypothetical protein